MDLVINNWGDLASVLSVVQSIVIGVSAIVALFGLSDNVKSRKLTLIREIIDEIGTEEIRTLRHKLYDDKSKMSSTEQLKLAVAYDRISFMLYSDKKLYKLILEFQGNEIKRIWNELETVVVKRRQEKNNPNYCTHFERIADLMD